MTKVSKGQNNSVWHRKKYAKERWPVLKSLINNNIVKVENNIYTKILRFPDFSTITCYINVTEFVRVLLHLHKQVLRTLHVRHDSFSRASVFLIRSDQLFDVSTWWRGRGPRTSRFLQEVRSTAGPSLPDEVRTDEPDLLQTGREQTSENRLISVMTHNLTSVSLQPPNQRRCRSHDSHLDKFSKVTICLKREQITVQQVMASSNQVIGMVILTTFPTSLWCVASYQGQQPGLELDSRSKWWIQNHLFREQCSPAENTGERVTFFIHTCLYIQALILEGGVRSRLQVCLGPGLWAVSMTVYTATEEERSCFPFTKEV